ncbi:hypothetical protein ACQKCH_15890 [Nubsella zeaxanthinifaciens]|uniref:hypothetical protein n=1 Tax=Nubsella zeaxanthinifaciens TaxID=392412 RepID=UPI003D042671
MKTVKFLMVALVAAFMVNAANAQTKPAKAPVKAVATANTEKKAAKAEAKADTTKKVGHKAAKTYKKVK